MGNGHIGLSPVGRMTERQDKHYDKHHLLVTLLVGSKNVAKINKVTLSKVVKL